MQVIITQGIEYQQLLDDVRALIRHEMAKHNHPADAPPTRADELLTIDSAAALLGVCVATIHEWKRRGVLAYVKIGGRAYLKRSELLAAGTAHQRTAKPTRRKSEQSAH